MNLGVGFDVYADIANTLLNPGGTGTGAGGVLPGSGMQPITVSPSFQQSFDPQFAPVMQQTQDSPGATQSAYPSQWSSGGQTARTGAPPGPSGYAPVLPDSSLSPRLPVALPPGYTDPYAGGVVQQSSDSTFLKYAIIGGVALVGLSVFLGKKGRTPQFKRLR